MNFGGIRNRTGTHPPLRFPNSPIYPLFAGIARPVQCMGEANTSNRNVLRTRYMLHRIELILNAHIQWVIFLRCSDNAHYPQGAPCPGFGYRIRQAVCKLRVCLCTGTSDAGISAPRWAQIGNMCVSFHAVSIHTEKVPHLPVAFPRRPHADIGTCSIRRCDGQALDIACRQEIRNTHDYSGIGNCPSQRRILG